MMRDASGFPPAPGSSPTGNPVMPAIYGPEPVHGWCYYFERASLAAQTADWGAVTEAGRAWRSAWTIFPMIRSSALCSLKGMRMWATGIGPSSYPIARTASRATSLVRCYVDFGIASKTRRLASPGNKQRSRKSRACSPAAGNNVLALVARVVLQCDELNKDVRMACIDMYERRLRADTYDV